VYVVRNKDGRYLYSIISISIINTGSSFFLFLNS
jgi:hypothetical protein